MQRILVNEENYNIASSFEELTRKYVFLARVGKVLCGRQIWLSCENDKHGTPEKVDLWGCG